MNDSSASDQQSSGEDETPNDVTHVWILDQVGGRTPVCIAISKAPVVLPPTEQPIRALGSPDSTPTPAAG